ncbi:hypothetical protein DICPUDRAFT_155606 [Dictyostelium purpureum]|uniref:Vacuolar protein sorting-associated protein n=1 Tax=Dictyostelium purpureum TaxID=5786 RepID=F0ZUG0_DICPU|nr:uncharacterized protein DICPUDRAFT_155606 [Dictyostelium purpureum]EGC32416.1 hypothetical protein DICPUDRAFT_155606 [Dictyostelium purpureum]|eukprot:XP_003291063.1 hypothetical protein DICPUDRAFT_155606 [Dictyostelium purpureum]
MVSKILPGILKKILGSYIEGLDKLSIPFWKGEIVLENLKFKKELFSSNEIPFQLLSGVIKRVVITIPWLHFLKDPIIVNIDGVFLLFGPKDIITTFGSYKSKKKAEGKDPNQPGNESEIKDDAFLKPNISKEDLKKIQSTIDEEQQKGITEGSDAESLKFKLMKKLLKCIKIQLNNLHICYQDDKTSPGEIFSVGVTLESFTFQNTDSQWVPLLSKNYYLQNNDINYDNDSHHNPFMSNPTSTSGTAGGAPLNPSVSSMSRSRSNSNLSTASGRRRDSIDLSSGIESEGLRRSVSGIPPLSINSSNINSDTNSISSTNTNTAESSSSHTNYTHNKQKQNQDEQPGQIVDQIITYKLASIFNFSIYWDSQFGKTRMVTPDDMDVLLMHSIPRQKAKIKHKYILQPISGFLKICLTEDSVESVNKEGVFTSIVNSFHISIGLKQIDFHLMDIQYRDMLNLLSFYQDWRRVLRYHKFRPNVPVIGNARRWWHFAFRSIISDFRSKRTELSWKEIEDSKKIRECYIKLYTEKYIKGKLNRLDQNLIEEIEKKVTYEDIILFRTIAERDLKVSNRKDLDQFTESAGWWLAGWLGFQHQNNKDSDKITLTNEELHFLERYLRVNLKKLAGKPHSSISINFFVNIKTLSACILDWRENHTVVQLANAEITEVNLQIEQAYNLKMKFSAQSLDIYDRCSPNTKFENIILEKSKFRGYSDNTDLDLEKKFIDISLILNPPEDTTDYFINLKLEPFYLINSKPFVDTMIPFFTHANQEALDRLKYSFIKKIKILQEYLIGELKHLIRNQKVADIKLDISVPGLVFPESYDREDTTMLVCNLGHLVFKTQPHNSEWDSMDFSEINEQDETDEIFVRYCQLLKDRIKWWNDNCPINKINEPIEKQSYVKNYVQQHRKAIEGGIEDSAKYPESDDIDETKAEQEGFDSTDTDWNKVSVNVNNAQFYDGIILTINEIYIKVCNFSEISNFEYLVSPFNFNIFLELCSRPYDLKLPQIKCKAELSTVNIQVEDKELYEIAKIVGKNGILEYFMDIDRKSSKELADMYEVIQVKKPKKKSFEIEFQLFSDTKSILNSRKRTKERLIRTTLLRFFFSSNSINLKLNYLDSCCLSMNIENIRCRSLVKFMQMNIEFDIASIEIKDSNSITPVLAIFPYHINTKSLNRSGIQNSTSSTTSSSNNNRNECLNKYPISISAKSISKNSLDYDYIDFILELNTQFIRVNFPKECIMALIAIIGTVATNTTNFYESKQSILTVEGSFYQGRIGQFDQTQQPKPQAHKKHHLSERLETNEFDPNDLKSKISINIPSFGLTLSSIENDLVSFHFEEISIDGIFQLPLVDCQLIVRDMKFIDYTSLDGPYPNMLITQKPHSSNNPGNPVVKMHLVSHADIKTQEWGYSRLINIQVGKIQITLLFQTINLIRLFVFDITQALKEYCPFLFKVMAIVEDDVKKENKKEKEKEKEEETGQYRHREPGEESPIIEIVKKKKNLTNLEIEIDNNVVILPKNNRSKSAIRCSVGKVILGLDQTDPTVDSVFVKIYGINMASKYEDHIDPIISDPVRMDIQFIHSFETSLKEKSVDVIIRMEKINLKLSQYQYNLIYNIYNQNINQSVVPGPPPSSTYTVERLNKLLDIRLEFKDFVELNLEDENTNDTRFFSMLINRPIIMCQVWNNGDSDFLIKTTHISVRDKNKLVVIPNGFQEMISITPYELDVPTKNIINQSINEVFFNILSMNIDGSGTRINITIEYLNIFFDLPWVSKLITFLSPIMDPDYINSMAATSSIQPPPPPPKQVNIQEPSETTSFSSGESSSQSRRRHSISAAQQQAQQQAQAQLNKDWKIFLNIEVVAKNANIMMGDLNSKSELVLLMNSSLSINSQFGSEGLMKIVLEYNCIKGLIGSRSKNPLTSVSNPSLSLLTSSNRDLGAQKNTTHYLWRDLKKSSKLFLETFKTNVQICMVPEGNQFYFCELNDLTLVFSGKSYRYLLDIYECLSNIIYSSSKSKDITNENIEIKNSRSQSISSDLPIPINIRHSGSSLKTNHINTNEKNKNQFYQIKTRSVEMLRAHQSRISEKYENTFSPKPIREYDSENEFEQSSDEETNSSLSTAPLSAPQSRNNKPQSNNLNIKNENQGSSGKQRNEYENDIKKNNGTITKIQFSQIAISIKNLNIIIMDDLSKHKMNTPIFNTKLTYGFLKAVLKTTRIEVEFDSVIQMNYFNNRIAYWEPFIEPWLFKSMMTLGKELSIDLFSTDLLNINFTIPLMDNISLFLRTYSKEFGYPFTLICAPQDDKKASHKNPHNRHSLIGQIKRIKEKNNTKTSYSPFFVRNRTGSRLRYRLETEDGKPVMGVNYKTEGPVRVINIENYGLFFELDSGDCTPIKFLPDVQINLETFSQLVLAVELLGVEKSISIPLDKIKVYDYQVYLDSTTETKLFANVGIKRGTKLITIQFPIVLKNTTSFPIDIATVTSGFGDTQMPNYTTTIQVGQARAPLPINRMKNVLIKFKPSGDQYKWSTETLDINNIIDGEDKYSCILKNGEKIYYIKGFVFHKNECAIIKLCHMLKVKNLLPYPIQFKLRTPIENIPLLKRESQATVQDLEKTQVYEIPLLDKFKIQVRIANKDGSFDNCEWSEVKSIVEKEDNHQISVITISDSNNLKVDFLHLNIEFISYKGEKKIVFYNQYWIYNKSALNIFCKKSYHSKDYTESQTNFNHFSELTKPNEPIIVPAENWYSYQLEKESPILYSFKRLKDMENSLRIRVGSSNWSHKFSIAAIGDRGDIVVSTVEKKQTRHYHLGLSVDLAPNLKTKVVVFTPRFVFHNLFSHTILIQQCGPNTESTLIRIAPSQSVPFYYFVDNRDSESKQKTLRFKLDYSEFDWSPPFSIQTFSDFTFQVYNNSEKEPEIHCTPYIRIKTCLEVATVLVIISELKDSPYRIMNNTNYQINVSQKKVGKSISVEPHHSLPYCWDLPLEEHELEVTVNVSDTQTEKATYKVDKIKTFKPMEFNDNSRPEGAITIKATVEADESTRVLTLNDKIGLQISKYEEENLRQSFRIHLTGIGISIINSNPTELLYVSIHDVLCEYFISNFLQKLEMKLTNIQVDNQLSKITPYSHPVLLFAENLLPNQPFLQVRIVRSMKMKNIDYYHHVSLKMQELNIKVEEKFLYVLLEFFNSLDFSFWTGNKKTKSTLHNMDMLTPMYADDIGEGFIDEMISRALPSIYGKKMYFESLDIEPISMFLTFDLSNKSGSITSLEQAPMVRAFRRIGFVIVSFQHAHIFLNGFSLSHAFGSNEELLAPIFNHYFSETLSEVYKILGAFNLFGNPVGLVKNFGIGFKEFFVGMGKGVVGNSFASSFSQGSKSLAKHSVYGLFDSGAKFTSSAGKALSTMSMDQRFILERQYIIGESPNNFMQGLILGGRAAKTAVYRGFSGFVRLPYEGGKEQGAKGVFKGIGKGTAGLVLKPVAAGFDFVSKVSEGIKNSTQLNIERKRIRFPRPLFSDSPLETYDSAESYGNFLFLTYIITTGKLRRISADQINLPLMEVVSKDEKYISHLIYKNKRTLLFTNKRIIYFYDTDGFRTKFDVKYKRIVGIIEKSDHIDIEIDKKHKLSFLYKEKNKKVDYSIKCNGDERNYIFQQIEEHCKIYKQSDGIVFRSLASKPPIPPPPPPPQALLAYNDPYQQLAYQQPVQYFNKNTNNINNVQSSKSIQPIIFTNNNHDPMKSNPILENLLAQAPNKNIDIPIWISQGYNPPQPPTTMIPPRFRDPNLYSAPYNSGYVYSTLPSSQTLSPNDQLIINQNEQDNISIQQQHLQQKQEQLQKQQQNLQQQQQLSIEYPSPSTCNTPHPHPPMLNCEPYYNDNFSNTGDIGTKGNIGTGTNRFKDTPSNLKSNFSRAVSSRDLSSAQVSSSVRKLKTPHHYTVRFDPTQINPEDYNLHNVNTKPPPTTPSEPPQYLHSQYSHPHLHPHQMLQQTPGTNYDQKTPYTSTTTTTTTSIERPPLQQQFSSNSIIETPNYRRQRLKQQQQQQQQVQQYQTPNNISLTPSGDFNYNDKFDLAINTIIQIQKIQSQQMCQLQKNQNEILQKLLFQQQQNTEFDNLKNQQEQIQNIISQYHPLSPSKANLLNKIQENENQSTGGASD